MKNCYMEIKSGFRPNPSLKETIGETGLYAVAGICALSLRELFLETRTDENANRGRGPKMKPGENHGASHGGGEEDDDEFEGALMDLEALTNSDRDFCHRCIRQLIQHLGLSERVSVVMLDIMNEGRCEMKSFKRILFEDQQIPRTTIGVCVLKDLVFFAVREGMYDARMRVLMRHVAWICRISMDLVEMYEETVVDFLTEEMKQETEEEKVAKRKKQRNEKIKKYALIGVATLGGGTLVGLTGGLAAPLIGAGFGTLLGGAGAAAAISSTAGMAVVGSMFGVAGAGLTGFKMQKRIGDVEEFAFDYLTEGTELHITIAVTGWLSEKSNLTSVSVPWRTLYNSREQYCLRYETRYLLELGKAMDYLVSFAVSMAAQEALKYTILAGLISAIAWPASLLTLASVIDNPWGVCCRRSAQVGRQLAEVLLQREHGPRPITLIGFSLGARVIFHCLQELAKSKNAEGIVQDAIIFGAPVSGHVKDWAPLQKVVSGRIINGYCEGDWLLKFLYRTSSVKFRIAGLGPIRWKNRRVFNFDLSGIVAGHLDYAEKMDIILKHVGIRTKDEFRRITGVPKSRCHFPSFSSVSGLEHTTKDCFGWDMHKHLPLRRTVSDSCIAGVSDEFLRTLQGGRNGPGTTPATTGWFGWQSPAVSNSLRSSLSEVNISRESLSSSASSQPNPRSWTRTGSQNRSFEHERTSGKGYNFNSRGGSTVGTPLSTSPGSPRSFSRSSQASSPARPRSGIPASTRTSHFPAKFATTRKLSDAEVWDMSLARERRFNQFAGSSEDGTKPPAAAQGSQLLHAAIETAQKVKTRGLARMESSPALGFTAANKFVLSPEVGGSFGSLFGDRAQEGLSPGVEADEDSFKDLNIGEESAEAARGEQETGEATGKKKAFFSFSWNN